MSTIYYAWSLGGGLGHLVPFLPIARRLTQRGHTVFAAAKATETAQRVFGDAVSKVSPIPAIEKPGAMIDPPVSFSHVLFNSGFHSNRALLTRVSAWRRLFSEAGAALVIADHAPDALVAAASMGIPRAVIGNPFTCPPPCSPLPAYPAPRTLVYDRDLLASNERYVLRVINGVFTGFGRAPLPTIADLFSQSDALFLKCLPEADGFSAMRPGIHKGIWWHEPFGKRVNFSQDGAQRVFLYLKPRAYVERMIAALVRRNLSVVAYVPRLSGHPWPSCDAPNLTLCDEPVDLAHLFRNCDLVIHNGSNGMAQQLLLAGIPQLMVPTHMEQRMTAERIEAQSLGLTLAGDDADAFERDLDRILTDPNFARLAKAMAARHATFDPDQSLSAIVDAIERLLPSRSD